MQKYKNKIIVNNLFHLLINKYDKDECQNFNLPQNLTDHINLWKDKGGHFAISCEKITEYYEKFKKFENHIKDILPKIGKNSNDVFNQRYALSWFAVKDELEQLASKNYISYTTFVEICDKHSVSTQSNKENEKSEAQTWLEVLHRIGSVIYFGKDEKLKDFIITNPDWIRDAFARVIEHKGMQEHHGKLSPSFQEEIWKKHTEGLSEQEAQEIRKKFVDLMLAYEFCYEQGETTKSIIVPSCLSSTKPTYPAELEIYDFEVKFLYATFIPAGIASRLMVKNCKNLASDDAGNHLKWKNGFVMKYDNASAEIIEDWKEKSIFIKIQAKQATKIFDFLKKQIQEFTKEYTNIKMISGLNFTIQFKHNNKWFESVEIEMYSLREFFKNILDSTIPIKKEDVNIEQFKESLREKIKANQQNAVVYILEEINKKLEIEQYDRAKWIAIDNEITAGNFNVGLLEMTKNLINSIQAQKKCYKIL